jgi:hypothetical protein
VHFGAHHLQIKVLENRRSHSSQPLATQGNLREKKWSMIKENLSAEEHLQLVTIEPNAKFKSEWAETSETVPQSGLSDALKTQLS